MAVKDGVRGIVYCWS